MKNNGKVHDVRSLACEIKVLNGRVLWTWKWTIGVGTGRSEKHFILPKHFFSWLCQNTWADQKVLKLLAYLFEYTSELYKTYTEY